MSIDLAYPLVLSMGQHYPLEGFVTYSELQAAATRDFKDPSQLVLKLEIAGIAKICRGINLATGDPFGIGGLLFDASRIAQGSYKEWQPRGNCRRFSPGGDEVLCERRIAKISCKVSPGLPRAWAVHRALGSRKPGERNREEPKLILTEEKSAPSG
jgi:hypothetical protein